MLFVHLKRFEFDLETFRKVKINDRVEFPKELDMRSGEEARAMRLVDAVNSAFEPLAKERCDLSVR